ncbi:hypothetical protein QLX67_08120 [Balneolaceae bacterium ANBcel3]|nr:hypothetical protein [Balneolaceae bacterium ANBcel3]
MIYPVAQPIPQGQVQPADAVPVVPQTNPYHQRGIPVTFRLPDKGSRTDDKEKDEQPYARKSDREEETALAQALPDMFQLILNKNFDEFFDFFFVPGHLDIVQLQSEVKASKLLSNQRLYRPEIIQNEKLDIIRHKLYVVTLDFHYSATGRKFFISI